MVIRLRYTALIFVWCASQSLAGPASARAAGKTLVLENDFLRATLLPDQGACLNSLVIKPKSIERLGGPSFVDSHLLPVRRDQGMAELAFQVEEPLESRSGDVVSWGLSAPFPKEIPMSFTRELVGYRWNAIVWDPDYVLSPLPRYENLRIRKRFTLHSGSPQLEVEYRIENTGKVPLQVCLGTKLVFRKPSAKRTTRLCVPTRDGPVSFPIPLTEVQRKEILCLQGSETAWFYDLPAAWAGSRIGADRWLVASFDPRHISFLKVDTSANLVQVGRTRVTIPPGQTFTTRGWLMPVKGMPQIDGARSSMASAFSVDPREADGAMPLATGRYEAAKPFDPAALAAVVEGDNLTDMLAQDVKNEDEEFEEELARPEDPSLYEGGPAGVTFRLCSPVDRSVQMILSERSHPKGEWSEFFKSRASLKAGEASDLTFKLKPRQKGSRIVRADIREKGKTIATFHHPLKFGHRSGFFLPAGLPVEGEINRDFKYWHIGDMVDGKPMWPYPPDWQLSMEVETPHFKLARPLAGGPLKTLFVGPYYRCREVVELGQRLDLAFDFVPVGVRGFAHKWSASRLARRYAPIDEIDRLRSALNKPHELIVLAVFLGDWFPKDIIDEIARQVEEEGAGLVFSLPEGLYGPFETHLKKSEVYEDLPRARVVERGKGRVMFLDGTSNELHSNWISREIYIGQDLNKDSYSQFFKAMLWAAGRSFDLAIEGPSLARHLTRADLANRDITFTVVNRGDEPFQGVCRIRPRRHLVGEYVFYSMVKWGRRWYPSWEEWKPVDVPVSLPPASRKALKIPAPRLSRGDFRLDLSFVDDRGKTAGWKEIPLTILDKSTISRIVLERPGKEDKHFDFASITGDRKQRTEKLIFNAHAADKITIACTIDHPSGIGRVEAVGEDPWHRLLFKEETKVESQEKKVEVRLQASLHNALHRVLILKIRTHDRFGLVHERRLLGFVFPRKERVHPYRLGAYSTCSDLRPGVTGYDFRVGSAVLDQYLAHAWCDVSMEAWMGGLPMATEIIDPNEEEPETPPELTEMKEMDASKVSGESEDDPEDQVVQLVNLEDLKEKWEREGPPPKKDWERIPCLNNPLWRKAAVRGITAKYKEGATFGPFSGGMGDEWFYCKEQTGKTGMHWRRQFIPGRDTNVCRCRYCLASFLDYARSLYGADLGRLNKEWGTSFAEWDEVTPPLLSTDPEVFPPESMWPHIIDHRHFIDRQVADAIGMLAKAVKAVDPLCRLGWGDLMGNTSIFNGLDASLVAPHMDNNQLNHELIEWASFGSFTNQIWVGYQKKFSRIRESWTAWSMLFAGNTAVLYYGKKDYPMHYADYRFMEGPKEMFRQFRFIHQKGIDRLLVGHRYNDPVAIHYDPRSIYIAELEEWKEDPKRFIQTQAIASRSHDEFVNQLRNNYGNLLRERNFQYFATAYGQLEEGHFGRFGTPRLLFLPHTQCISKKQAEALEKFVREGGVLVGDVHAGFRNEHGKRLPAGHLDHVFGIRQTGKHGMRLRLNKEGKRIPVHFGESFGEGFALTFDAVGPGDVSADTAKSLARYTLNGVEQPAFLVNEFGRGKAIYLNYIPVGYKEAVGDEAEMDEIKTREMRGRSAASFRRMFGKIVDLAGLSPPVECEGVSLNRFGEKDLTYIAISSGYKHLPAWRRDYELRIPKARHLYDVRARSYLGLTDQVKFRFRPEEQVVNQLYAAYPYKVTGIDLRIEPPRARPGGTVFVTASLRPPEAKSHHHVLAMRVLNPNGEDLDWYGTCIETVDGIARGRVDLSLNDMKGNWRIRLTDAGTNVSAEARFVVEP